jgi:predicted RNase H-like HicB family nuclease
MTFRIVLEVDPDADSFSATCPELPGCASAGDTEEEARQNIEEAIRLYLARAERVAGSSIPASERSS